MLTEQQTSDIAYVKKHLIEKISEVSVDYDILKEYLTHEVAISIVYLRIFSAYLEEQKFGTLEEAWRFMNDIKGIIEKLFYVSNYIIRVKEARAEEKNKDK